MFESVAFTAESAGLTARALYSLNKVLLVALA